MFMGYWFKCSDIKDVSEYHFYFVGVIALNCMILQLLVNFICNMLGLLL